MTFASMYSGIGGADAGLVACGWKPQHQIEANTFRRAVLKGRFGVPVSSDVADAVDVLPDVEALYVELPDSRIDQWWAPVRRVVEKRPPEHWLIVEFSPTVRCEQILRDIIFAGWAFRLVQVSTFIHFSERREDWDIRRRGVIMASPDAAAVDRIQLAGMAAELVIEGVHATAERGSPEWHEVSRGLRAGWTCGCGQDDCRCHPQYRIDAVNDATSPFMSKWLGDLITGAWGDGLERKYTKADGTIHA